MSSFSGKKSSVPILSASCRRVTGTLSCTADGEVTCSDLIHSLLKSLEGDGHSTSAEGEKPLQFPPVSPESLHQICDLVSSADFSQKDTFPTLLKEQVSPVSASHLQDYRYLRQLLQLLPVLESSKQVKRIQELGTLCTQIREFGFSFSPAVDLGYDDVVSVLFGDDLYLHFFGIMECTCIVSLSHR